MDALLGLNAYDWLVFTSVNGVTAFFDIFFRRFQDMRDIGGVRIAAVGPATAAKLRELHLLVDLMPDEFTGKKIAAAFDKFETIENLKMCLLRAEVANPDLPKALEELGAIVDDIAIYKTVAETEDPAGAGMALLESGADWITFTSGSTVEHFHARFDLPKLLKKFPQMKLASIGPETSKAIRALGLEPALEAKAHTTEGLLAALLKATGSMNILRLRLSIFINFRMVLDKMERSMTNLFGSGLILAALCLGGARLDAASFTAALDRDTINLGESATLSLTFEDGSPRNVPTPPNVAGLQIAYVGPSSQFSFVNGETKSTVTV